MTKITCDACGVENPGRKLILQFNIGGREFDLCEKHMTELDKHIEEWLKSVRRTIWSSTPGHVHKKLCPAHGLVPDDHDCSLPYLTNPVTNKTYE